MQQKRGVQLASAYEAYAYCTVNDFSLHAIDCEWTAVWGLNRAPSQTPGRGSIAS
jgi:hypothetical protein